MIKSLLANFVRFSLWWFVYAPRRLYTVLRRILIFANYEFSFGLNIKLLFVPLFGDYTLVGRFIGFVFRVLRILFSLVFIVIASIISVLVLLVWFVFPVFLLYYFKLWTVPLTGMMFLTWLFLNINIPEKKISAVSEDDMIKSFRPKAAVIISGLLKAEPYSIQKLFLEPNIALLFKRIELINQDFQQKFVSEIKEINMSAVIKSAFDLAEKQKSRYVELEHVLYALFANNEKIDNLLSSYSVSLDLCEGAVAWIIARREELSKVYFWQEDFVMPKMGGVNKGMTGRITPLLDSVSEDFTEMARKGLIKKIIGRTKEKREIAELLSNAAGENILIIGEPGSGKTSLVKGIAMEIVRGTEFESVKFKRVVSILPGALMAGTKTVGDITAKVTKIMEEVEGSGNIILFIDEIHNLVSAAGGESEASSIFSVLEPHLASSNIQFIGATNVENYRKYIEPNGAFSRLFQIIEISEATKEDTLKILETIALNFESTYKVLISYASLKKAIELSDKLMHERVLPDKAIDILLRAVVSVAKTSHYLKAEDIAVVVSEITKIPVTSITEEESKKLLDIEAEMKKRVIGQDPAIVQIGSAMKRARVGIRNEKKPIASFLFVGTTGVGKTETAKALAQTYFGSEKAMIRLDMSEYQQQDSINRLIGAPDGSSRGLLTEAVRSTPFSLILLDEIEKAYPNILLAFLQVMDDGRLTDSNGRVVDFTNSIIIATSNVGTRTIQDVELRGGLFEEMQETGMKEVREKFAPEFLNRFNGIIVFRPLSPDAMRKIAGLQLNRVRKMAEEKNIKVSFRPELIEELSKRGFDPQWGARPLARLIESTVESYLAVKLLKGEIQKGDELVLGMEVFADER